MKIEDLEIKLTPKQLRQHMALELKYEKMKRKSNPPPLSSN